MAKNWSAYEAAVALYGDNKDEIAEVGSRFPLFTRNICLLNNEQVLDLLKAIPKVTARVVETGLKEMEAGEPEEVIEDEAPAENTHAKEKSKETAKGKKAAEAPEDEEDEDAGDDYESMTSKALYKLCCDRGISSQCKKRDKASLIAVLKANDTAGDAGDEDDEWDEEEEENSDPYAGKTARELYKMCKDRGIKTKPQQKAEAYVKLLKKADEEAAEAPEDEDDDWEI